MGIQFNNIIGGACGQEVCPDKFGCPPNTFPDFTIRRHDTRPPFKVFVEDCEGPLDLQGLVLEVNMWALAKLKADLNETCDFFRLADDIGFEQIMVGDIIVMDRIRLPEHMLVIGFDEKNKLVKVERGARGTNSSSWKKGEQMRIFRVMSAPAETEMAFDDIQNIDGTIDKDVNTESFLVYEWEPEDTCLPGCYWLEFKLLKMKDVVFFLPGGTWSGEVHKKKGCFFTGSLETDSSVRLSFDQVTNLFSLPSTPWPGEIHTLSDGTVKTGSVQNDGSVILSQSGIPSSDRAYDEESLGILSTQSGFSLIPSFTDPSLTPYYFGCILGEGVEWVRRFPVCGEGFLIKIEKSHTTES